jgi:2-methylcitrate dehydratase
MHLAQKLSDHALSLGYEDLAEDVVHKTKQRIVDSIGCALGGFHSAPVEAAIRLAQSVPVDSSAILHMARMQY